MSYDLSNGLPSRRRGPRHGMTLLEVLILIGIGASVCVMLFPAVQSARESARRSVCARNLMELGRAVQEYAAKHNQLPASSAVTRGADGKITAVEGWSWQVMMLPYLDHEQLYNRLDIANGRPLAETSGNKPSSPEAEALATSLSVLLCPSSGCSPFADGDTKLMAITNYKVLGATHAESLSIASPHPLTPKYILPAAESEGRKEGIAEQHPDGASFPGSALTFRDFPRGTSHTLLLVESMEQHCSRWALGAEATLVGLPANVEFEKDTLSWDHATTTYAPKGYRKALTKSPDAESTYWTYHTYLDWDYDQQPYESTAGGEGARYGPGSGHVGVVHHEYIDGSIQALHRDIDVAVYMSLITRYQVAPYGNWNE